MEREILKRSNGKGKCCSYIRETYLIIQTPTRVATKRKTTTT